VHQATGAGVGQELLRQLGDVGQRPGPGGVKVIIAYVTIVGMYARAREDVAQLAAVRRIRHDAGERPLHEISGRAHDPEQHVELVLDQPVDLALPGRQVPHLGWNRFSPLCPK